MASFLDKTLFGLTAKYYFRQFVFGVVVATTAFLISIQFDQSMIMAKYFFAVVSTLLYPYARFFYERSVAFIVGNHVFFTDPFSLAITKLFTITLCLIFSILLAPLGLVYLYFYHSSSVE